MHNLSRIFIVAFPLFFLIPLKIVSAFGDDNDSHHINTKQASPSPKAKVKEKKELPQEIIFTGYLGRVNKVWYKNGDFIEEGEVLFELEAMKMIMNIRAPFSGVISNATQNYVDQILAESDALFTLRQKDHSNDQNPSSSQKDHLSKTLDNNSLSPPQNASTNITDRVEEDVDSESILTKDYHSNSVPSFSEKARARISLPSKISFLFLSSKWRLDIFKGKNLIPFSKGQELSSYGVFFCQKFLNFSFKNPLKFEPYTPLNFSKRCCFLRQKIRFFSFLRPRISHQRFFFETMTPKTPLFLKIDIYHKNLPASSSPKKIFLKQDASFQAFILAPKKELLLWNLITLYGLLSLGLALKTRRLSPSFLLFYFLNKQRFFLKYLD